MKYIYLTETTDGYFYVGKHSWPGNGLDPSYFGSGKRLRDHPIKSTIILEDCTSLPLEDYNQRESYWITYYANLLGVLPFHSEQLYSIEFSRKYSRPGGRLLNCHDTISPDRSSGFWVLGDDLTPLHLPDISEMITGNRTTISSIWGKLGRPESFTYDGYWIHRSDAVGGPVYQSGSHVTPQCISAMVAGHTEESYKSMVATQKSTSTFEYFQHKGCVAAHTEESLMKAKSTRKSHHPRYRLQDGFEGDYIEIAEHIGYTGSLTKEVSRYLRGARSIPPKWSALNNAVLV